MHDPNRRKHLQADVHRLKDHVAIAVGTGETTYLSPDQAEQLAEALTRAVKSVRHEPYGLSDYRPFNIQIN